MRKETLGEVLFDELKAIREYVSDIPAIKTDLAIVKDGVEILKTDMCAVKSMLKAHDKEIKQIQEKVGI